MNAYEILYWRLKEKGFEQYKGKAIEHLGVALFYKDHLAVIIQNLELGMKLNDIKEESIRIREKIHQINLNVWNTYYILCADDKSVYQEDLLFIERDSTGLRKYVISEESDLNRIPFLDNQPVNLINDPILVENNLSEGDTLIRDMYEFIEKNNGTNKIITDTEINKLIDTFLEGDKLEN